MTDDLLLTLAEGGSPRRIAARDYTDRCFTIGRGAAADLFLNDPSIQGRHAGLRFDADGWWLEPLTSVGGVAVDGQAIEGPRGLVDGDTLTIGGVALRVALVGRRAARTARREVPMIEVAAEPVVLGRGDGATVRLEHPLVSRRHAEVRRESGQMVLRDLASTNGTYVDGRRVTVEIALETGADIAIGPFSYRVVEGGIRATVTTDRVALSVEQLGVTVTERRTGRALDLLDDVNLGIRPGELVALIGEAGSGKSTFLKAIAGRDRPDRGRVRFGRDDLYERFPALRQRLGFVPQDVIFHDELTVRESLRYTCRLRLSRDISDAEVDTRLAELLELVGLGGREDVPIRSLSGGQKKRVALATELVSDPHILFLDEVTSGLDLGSERQAMELFRRLADGGKTVVCVTHHVHSLDLVDLVACFRAGRLIYFGPPAELQRHFSVTDFGSLYDAARAERVADQVERFQSSGAHARFVVARVGARAIEPDPEAPFAEQAQMVQILREPSDFACQLRTLLRRNAAVYVADRVKLGVTLAMAPLLAMLIALLCQPMHAESPSLRPVVRAQLLENAAHMQEQLTISFAAVITMFFLGQFASVREIVKEVPIYRHERFVNLQILPYLLSKVGTLAVVVVVQALLVVGVLRSLAGWSTGGSGAQLFILTSVGLTGSLLGLAISSCARGSDAAVSMMIGTAIPQTLFAGVLVPVEQVTALVAKIGVAAYWAVEAFKGLYPKVDVSLALPDAAIIPNSSCYPDGWRLAACALVIHAGVYGVAALYLLARKDGRGVLRRVWGASLA